MATVTGEGVEKLEDMIVRAAESTAAHIAAAKSAIGAVIFGQERVVEEALITVLSGGHAHAGRRAGPRQDQAGRDHGHRARPRRRRIQFTPDLMPSDILGSEVLEENPGGKRSFRFIPGPIFGQLLMADEINRASPRTQSALLQAMQEQHVTVAGARHDVPKPFHVLATQNPIEQEGTYPLPEAQLDRFLMQIDVRLSRPRRRTAHRVRDHGRRRGEAEAGDDVRRTDRGAAPGAPPAGRRIRDRCDPLAGALGASGPRCAAISAS